MRLSWRDRLRIRVLKWLGVLVLPVRPPFDVIVLRSEKYIVKERRDHMVKALHAMTGCRVVVMDPAIEIAAILHVAPSTVGQAHENASDRSPQGEAFP